VDQLVATTETLLVRDGLGDWQSGPDALDKSSPYRGENSNARTLRGMPNLVASDAGCLSDPPDGEE